MKFYEIVIRPISGFGTPLKGDTLFGHFCWQVAYDPHLVEGGLEYLVEMYNERPLIIFSTAYPRFEDNGKVVYALRRPDVPLTGGLHIGSGNLRERILRRKELKAKRWLLVDESFQIQWPDCVLLSDVELAGKYRSLSSARNLLGSGRWHDDRVSLLQIVDLAHNTINRLTGTTGTGGFAPFFQECHFFLPGILLTIFVLFDHQAINREGIIDALTRIGKTGFGRDASTGMGRFEVCGHRSLDLARFEPGDGYYCLSPVVPEQGRYKARYFTPFVRFGRHGDRLARGGNPFKAPVVMADEGAVFFPRKGQNGEHVPARPYMGKAIRGISKLLPGTVMQGYSIIVPFRLEKENGRVDPINN